MPLDLACLVLAPRATPESVRLAVAEADWAVALPWFRSRGLSALLQLVLAKHGAQTELPDQALWTIQAAALGQAGGIVLLSVCSLAGHSQTINGALFPNNRSRCTDCSARAVWPVR
jgi:hypothetical protein